MKKILGLDIGTNSIGGALIELDTENYGKNGNILWLGSRIVPVDGDALQKFENGGQVVTKAANRRIKRGSRRLKHRYKLRRTRLIETLKILDWVPDNFPTDFKKDKSNGIEFKMKDYLPFSENIIKEASKALNIKPNKKGEINVAEDWVVYYLRKKALFEKIDLCELARILYMLNQRRGFKSSRKDLQDETTILPYDEFIDLTNKGIYEENGKTFETKFVEVTKVKSVKLFEKGESSTDKDTYEITTESSKIKSWKEKRHKKPEWEGQEFRFLVTQKSDKKKKEIVQKKKPEIPSNKDWNLAMISLDNEIEASGKQVGEFFFDKLIENKNYLIRQQVVKRERYQKELRAIWTKQCEFHPELTDSNKLAEIARKLYPSQAEQKSAKWKEIMNNTLFDLVSKDIIYYQRDLKSQKHLIDRCHYEKKTYTYNDKEGKEITVTDGYKVAPKSCPEFQEFRIWQDIHNIRVLQKEDEKTGKVDINVFPEGLSNEIKAELFNYFDTHEEVKQNQLLKKIDKTFSEKTHRINLFSNRKTLKGNETKALFKKVFNKYSFNGEHLLNDKDKFQLLWHILYSITGKEHEKGITRALTNPKHDFNLPEEVVVQFAEKTKEFPSQYAAYSRKAIKKLLPLMRCGEFWNADNVIPHVSKFLEWKETEAFKKLGSVIQPQLQPLEALEDFEGLQTSTACYVVYGRHSERESDTKYTNWDDKAFDISKLIPTNSLRNPIVEQVVRETMQVAKEVWKQYGRPDEIHIEMGRDLKNTVDERKHIAENQGKNYIEKQRVKRLLKELNEGNPESPLDIEKFRLWKHNGGWEADEKFNKLFDSKNNFVRGADIEKYRLWAEQHHHSPYTGKQIPLNKLFTSDYEKEHVIPRSKLKNDSMANLVICEAAVNDFKGNRLAQIMINEDGGREHTHKGVKFSLLSIEDYRNNCKFFNKAKRKNLTTEEVPEGFIERQINDTRHITRRLSDLLYPVTKDQEGVIFTIGHITHELKQKWGITKIWKELIKYRFERLQKILGHDLIIEDGNNFHFNKPDDKVDLKRIDHRHHAMDALVIAATTRRHIKYLNTLNNFQGKKEWEKQMLAKKDIRDFIAPWPNFTKDAKDKLCEVIISHKYNNRVLRKPHNRYWKWEKQPDGNWKKILKKQQENDLWRTVKLAMFNENPQGSIFIKEPKPVKPIDAIKIQIERAKGIKDDLGKPRDYIYDKHSRKQIIEVVKEFNSDLNAIKKHLKKNPLMDNNGNLLEKVIVAYFIEYAAKRMTVDNTFDEKKIESLPYAKRTIERCGQKLNSNKIFAQTKSMWPLPFLLTKHLEEYNGNPKEAFVGEGLEMLYKKAGRPIKKVTKYEKKVNPLKLNCGIWETAKGGNVYFVIRENLETRKREYYTPPLFNLSPKNEQEYGIINRLLAGEPIAGEQEGWRNIILKVGDLVYVPTPEELEHPHHINEIDWNGEDKKRVFERTYIAKSFNKYQAFFAPHNVATPLEPNAKEMGANNKAEKAWDGTFLNNGTMIKEYCIPIIVDRLGNIVKVNGRSTTVRNI